MLHNVLYKAIVLASAISLLSGCAGNSGGRTVQLDLEAGRTVTVDSIATGEWVLNPLAMRVVDTTLVVAGKQQENVLHLFSTPDLKPICTGMRIGQGPGEFISPMPFTLGKYDEHSISMLTGFPATIAIVDIPRIEVNNTCSFKLPDGWTYVQWITTVGKEFILAQNGEMPLSIALVDSTGDVSCMIDPNIPESVKNAAGDDEFAKIKVSVVLGAASELHRRIAICYRSLPLVELYDFDGKRVASLTMPYDFDGLSSVWIATIDPKDDGLYINFHDPADKAFTRSSIVKIDWNGNILDRYCVPKAVGAFAADERNRQIYFSSFPESDFIYLFKL